MANYDCVARCRGSGRTISFDVTWHAVVANPVRLWRGDSSLCKAIADPGCDGPSVHAAASASNRLRILVGCLVVLLLSFLSFFILLPSPFHQTAGVPLKDNAVQSGCFALCAFTLAFAGVRFGIAGNRRRAAAMIFVALAFSGRHLHDLFFKDRRSYDRSSYWIICHTH